MTKAGRPTFNIKPDRLRALRKQAGMTQKALAEPVFSVATLKSVVSDPRTPTNTYQRIERTGKTSEKAARRIAEVLAQALKQDPDKTFAALCGGQPEPPPDRIDEIEKQLRAQLEGGVNASLEQALQRHNDADSPVRELAQSISTRLEVAQLEQRSDELKLLTALTGWTADELQRPTSQQGYWLLVTNTYGHRETQIVLGVSEVLYQIRTRGGEWLDAISESDARVELTEDAPWLRVRLMRPRHSMFYQEFSFVRCAPSATGLQWVKPTEWDRWMINGEFASGLKDWAFQHANFVKGFQAEDKWPRELGCLRMLVQQWVKPVNPDSAEDSDRWKNVAAHKGCLDEYPETIRDNFRAEGQEHYLVTNWLASGLWDDVLAPLLSPIPADWWCIEAWGAGVQIRTEVVSISRAARYGLGPDGLTYHIHLAEELPSGELRAAPWRQRCVNELVERLQKDLKTCQDTVAIGPKRPAWLTAA
jgi:transcriptional regulator with XRE-family HTH domain